MSPRVDYYRGKIIAGKFAGSAVSTEKDSTDARDTATAGICVDCEASGCTRVDVGTSSAILVGYLALSTPESQSRRLEELLTSTKGVESREYLSWDGNFTILLLDHQRPSLRIYKNLLASTFTYYSRDGQALLFGSTLADLLLMREGQASVNSDALALLFLYRFVPGRMTLATGVHRLSPGECLTYDANGLGVEQVSTFRQLRGSSITARDVVHELEHTMGEVLTDVAAHDGKAVNLLSGGVDSSYIQAHWNQVCSGSPRSACVSVAHEMTRPDLEAAIDVARLMGTQHQVVEVSESYAHLLRESISVTGEMPNHVQSCYFGLLARGLLGESVHSVLCGEGADSLFGTVTVSDVAFARRVRTMLPNPMLRELAGWLASRTGHPTMAGRLRLANVLNDEMGWRHPYNQAGAFADWNLTRRCFSMDAIQRAFSYRHEFVSRYQGGSDVIAFAHDTALLCEGLNTAAYWTALMGLNGVRMICPFLDSRVVRLALNLNQKIRFDPDDPKGQLKTALEKYLPQHVIRQPKRGFGQPIFEWLANDTELLREVDQIEKYAFLTEGVLGEARGRPSWFLYSLLCFDKWSRAFARYVR